MRKWSLAVAAVALFTSLGMTSAGAMTRLSSTQMDRITAGSNYAQASAWGGSSAFFGVVGSSVNAASVSGFWGSAAVASNTEVAAGFLVSASSAAEASASSRR